MATLPKLPDTDTVVVDYIEQRYNEALVEWQDAWDKSQRADDERDRLSPSTSARDTTANGLFYRWQNIDRECQRLERVKKGNEAPSAKDRREALRLAGTLR